MSNFIVSAGVIAGVTEVVTLINTHFPNIAMHYVDSLMFF